MIAAACQSIPPGCHGALIGQVDESGVRGVYVTKIDGAHVDFDIVGWVGKEWRRSDLSAGVAVQLAW